MCEAEDGSGDVGWPGLHIEDQVFCISKFPHRAEAEGAKKKGLIFPSTCFILMTGLIENL